MQINVYVIQIFSEITTNSFENKWRQKDETLLWAAFIGVTLRLRYYIIQNVVIYNENR